MDESLNYLSQHLSDVEFNFDHKQFTGHFKVKAFHLVCIDEEEDEENKFSQQDDQQNDKKLKKRKVNIDFPVLSETAGSRYGICGVLTLRRRHLFSLMAPRQPKNPVTMTMLPRVMMRLAAESDGKEGERVAKLP